MTLSGTRWTPGRKALVGGVALVSALAMMWFLLFHVPAILTEALEPAAGWAIDPDVELKWRDKRVERENDVRATIFQIVGGIALASGLYFNYRQRKNEEDTASLEQQGQITQRFTEAVKLIGGDNAGLRVGGLYALARVARDSPGDVPSVISVLTAFLRESSATEPKPVTDPDPASEADADDDADGGVHMASDRQAALTILADLSSREKATSTDRKAFDLRKADLRGARAENLDLRWWHLEGADLTRARLAHAKLTGVRLNRARLDSASLSDADLDEAYLNRARLCASDLSGANLKRARLIGADVTDARIFRTVFEQVNDEGLIDREGSVRRAIAAQRAGAVRLDPGRRGPLSG